MFLYLQNVGHFFFAFCYVPVRRVDARLVFAESHWPSAVFLPRPLHDAPDEAFLRDLFTYERRVFVQQAMLSTVVHNALEQRVPRRSVEEKVLREEAIANILAIPVPRRFR